MAFLTAEQLLRQARERPEALGEFYDRYEAAVLAYFMRRTNDAHQAVDLTAETFAEVVLQAHRGAQIDNATAWLFAVARSKLVDAHRRGRVDQRARRRLAIERVEAIDEQLERVESLGGDPRVAGLSHALEALPDAYRDAVIARVVDEASYADIAASAGADEQVVRKRVSRGLASLRKLLEG